MTNTDQTKQATEHSPEPWHIEPLEADHGASIAICNRQQGILAVIPPLNEDDAPNADTAQRYPCDEPNARRLTAAVNGCQGIPTEALAQGIVAELHSALQWIVDDLTDAEEDRNPETGDEYDSVAHARAAIAKAKGQAA
jgi:hypothetical protein